MKATNDQLGALLATVELYRVGHYSLDKEKLKRAFHPNAHIVGYVSNGDLMFINRDEYLFHLSSHQSSEERGELPNTKVVSVDFTETTAVVKVESLLSGARYSSQLSMIKIKHHWQIVSGLFQVI